LRSSREGDVMSFDSRPYSVHITPSRRKVRRYVCRRATEEQAAYAADKCLRGMPGAVAEIFRGRLGDSDLVTTIRGRAS